MIFLASLPSRVLSLVFAPVRLIANMSGCGCLVSLLTGSAGVLLAIVLLAYFVGLQQVGPRIENGSAIITGSDGEQRLISFSESGAISFDLKVSQAETTTGSTVVEISINESELNSKLQELLLAEFAVDPDFPVTQTLVVLTAGRATLYVNGHELGRDTGAEVRVALRLSEERRIELAVERVKLGGLPSMPFSRQLGDTLLDTLPLADELEEALPAAVQDVRIEEGRLVIEVIPNP